MLLEVLERKKKINTHQKKIKIHKQTVNTKYYQTMKLSYEVPLEILNCNIYIFLHEKTPVHLDPVYK